MKNLQRNAVCVLCLLICAALIFPVSAAAEGYVLRELGGKLAVYATSGELLMVTGIPTSSLRETDRLAVEKGITAASWEEIIKLLEDFGS